jgi:hypothetical protein
MMVYGNRANKHFADKRLKQAQEESDGADE